MDLEDYGNLKSLLQTMLLEEIDRFGMHSFEEECKNLIVRVNEIMDELRIKESDY